MMHVIYVPIWDTRLHLLLWPDDPRAALAEAGITGKDADEMLDEQCTAITWTNDKGAGVILIRKPHTGPALIGLLAHEIFHAVHDMLAERGVKLRNKDANEPHAYLLGYLLEEAVKLTLDKPPQAS